MTVDALHRDRARAESFGSVAEQYDRYRPGPPEALVDDLVALRPARVLDVGCGTGKAAVAMAGRGLAVLGVEPDPRMAEVALGHGVPVEAGTFETWDPAGRRFDLITFVDSWHWVDPAAAVPRAAQLLPAGGAVARWWNDLVLEDPVIAAFDAVYRRHAPEVVQTWRPSEDRAWVHAVTNVAGVEPFAASGAFHPATTSTYRWERDFTAEQWVAMTATTSSHQRLEPARLAALSRDLHAAIEGLGGTLHSHHETYLVLSRRVV